MDEAIGTKIEEETRELSNKVKKTNPWLIISIILIIGIVVLLFVPNPLTGNSISETEAGESMVEYLNAMVGGGVELIEVQDQGSLYEITVLFESQEIPVYMTKDGKYFVQGASEMIPSDVNNTGNNTQPDPTPAPIHQPSSVPKNDKPVVELFIMSHCPYGTQAEKGMLPVARTLGDKIDFKIKFVYYAMHGETEVLEQLNQYCIQEEQEDKFLDYLDCFLEDGDGETCLTEVEIDTTALETCTAAADEEFDIIANLEDESSWLSGRFPKFNTDLEDNQKYSVGGSPTLIINGADSSAGRDSASYLAGICNAFNEAPEECNEELSSASPGPGFGWSTTGGSNSAAQCG